MWGTIELTYDETEIHNKKIRPFKVMEFTPFQVSVINPQEYIDKRSRFTTDEWIDVLINSCGLNPDRLTRRQKLLYLCRCIPMVETNANMIELGPPETGKTYLYRNISQAYMQDAKFSRGKKEILAFGSLVFVGNLDVQGNLPHEKYYHLFEPLPDFNEEISSLPSSKLCSPKCLDFIYSLPTFAFFFNHLILSPCDSRT